MKNSIGIIFFLCLLIVAYWLFIYQPKVEQREDFKDFAIEDTASVEKIFIGQPNGKKVLLSRNSKNQWIVNNDFPARKDAIELILTTVHDIKIRGPVSQQTFTGVVKRLATGSTKVEYYMKGSHKPEKTWYVGDATADRMGTYMLLEKDKEKSKSPYITHLLRERGFLGPRFFPNPILWKDPVLLRLNPKGIKSISVEHVYDSISPFTIIKNGEKDFSIKNLKTAQVYQMAHERAIPYFKEFSKVFYDYIDYKTPNSELDSIYSSPARHSITIQLEDGSSHQIRTFNIPVAKDVLINEKPIPFNQERMYTYSSYMGKELHPIVQNLTFDILVPSFEDFASSTNVEK